jgi:hypothetical protein
MTKAQKLGITKFPYVEKNAKRKITYMELESGLYLEYKYNKNDQIIFYKNFSGAGFVEEFDSNGNSIFYMNLKDWNKILKRNEIILKILD